MPSSAPTNITATTRPIAPSTDGAAREMMTTSSRSCGERVMTRRGLAARSERSAERFPPPTLSAARPVMRSTTDVSTIVKSSTLVGLRR